MPPRTGVKVKLGGKQRTLRYTMPALRKLEDERNGEALGRTLFRVGNMQVSAIVALVWAGLLHETPDLTMDEAAELIEPPLVPLAKALEKALEPWGDEPEGDEGNPKAAD